MADPGSAAYCCHATCSVLPRENSDNIAAFCSARPARASWISPRSFGLKQAHGRQLLPQADGHDGFYHAKLIKIAASPAVKEPVKIIILGAGQVGGTPGGNTCRGGQRHHRGRYRCRAPARPGRPPGTSAPLSAAVFPTVLRQAGADDADMLVAVTNSDEINMIACQVAYTPVPHPDQDRPGARSRLPDRSEACSTTRRSRWTY